MKDGDLEVLKKLRGYASGQEWRIVVVVAFITVACICSAVTPALIADIINEISKGVGSFSFDRVVDICTIVVAMVLAYAVFRFTAYRITIVFSEGISYSLRRDMIAKVGRMPLQSLDGEESGDVASKIVNDTDSLSTQMAMFIVCLVIGVVGTASALVMMLMENVILTAVTLVCNILSVFFLKYFVPRIRENYDIEREALGEMNSFMTEELKGMQVTMCNGGEKRMEEDFADISGKLMRSTAGAEFYSSLSTPIVYTIFFIGVIAITYVGYLFVVGWNEEHEDIGTVIAFLIYSEILISPLTRLGMLLGYYQATISNSRRIFGLLSEIEESERPDSGVTVGRGEVSFDHVSFGYDDRRVIDDVCMSVPAGCKAAIVGPTGAGKTTLMSLLLGFYDADSGRITVDGAPVDCFSRKELGSIFGTILQEPWVFEGTLRDNIMMGREADDRLLERTAESLGLKDFLDSMPQGLDTKISRNGVLSAGQYQLICIIRAVIHDPTIYVLDEATSFIDVVTERRIQDIFDRVTEKKTSIVIAHRLSTIRNADIIFYLENGRILERGTHEELYAMNGRYRAMYDTQF